MNDLRQLRRLRETRASLLAQLRKRFVRDWKWDLARREYQSISAYIRKLEEKGRS